METGSKKLLLIAVRYILKLLCLWWWSYSCVYYSNKRKFGKRKVLERGHNNDICCICFIVNIVCALPLPCYWISRCWHARGWKVFPYRKSTPSPCSPCTPSPCSPYAPCNLQPHPWTPADHRVLEKEGIHFNIYKDSAPPPLPTIRVAGSVYM